MQNTSYICSLIDAKNDNVYFGLFKKEKNGVLQTLEDLSCQNINITGGTIDIDTDAYEDGIRVHSSTTGIKTLGVGIFGYLQGEQTFAIFTQFGMIKLNSVQAKEYVEIGLGGQLDCLGNAYIQGNLTVNGEKNRVVTTENYGKRLL